MLKAAIFDLDGTVLDNEGKWEEAFVEVAKKNNIVVDEMHRQPNGWWHEPGMGLEPNWKRIILDPNLAKDLTREVVVNYLEKINNYEDITIANGLEAALTEVRKKEWLTALCTGSAWYVVEKALEQLKLYMAFDVTTTGEEMVLQKPDPEIYFLTAGKLGVETFECLVIEDSIAGVRSGAEAGCMVVGLASGYAPKEMLTAAGAQIVIENMNELAAKIKELE